MLTFIRKIVKYIYKKNKYKNLSKCAYIGTDFHFGKYTQFITKGEKSITINNNVMCHGKLYASDGGKIIIDDFTSIRKNCKLFSAIEIKIGKYVIFSDNIIITDSNHHPVSPTDRLLMIKSGWSTESWSWKYSRKGKVEIKDNVWIGQNSRINKGVTIGENSIVAANSVVTKNVPPNSIVAGNPAKLVKTNIDNEKSLF